MDLVSWSQLIQYSGLLDPLLDQFVESAEIGRTVVLGIALHLHWVVLQGLRLRSGAVS